MPLTEPMTLVTDYILAILGGWFGVRLWALAGSPQDRRRIWAAAFWAMGLAALLGGTHHGFSLQQETAVWETVWKGTMTALGATSCLLFLAALVPVVSSKWRRVWLRVLAAKLALFVGWVWWIDSSFKVAIIDYGLALLAVLVVHLVLAARRISGSWPIVAGVLVSFCAAAIQQLGLSPHPSFNHNDLYHVIQMAGLYLLFLGARRAPEAE